MFSEKLSLSFRSNTQGTIMQRKVYSCRYELLAAGHDKHMNMPSRKVKFGHLVSEVCRMSSGTGLHVI